MKNDLKKWIEAIKSSTDKGEIKKAKKEIDTFFNKSSRPISKYGIAVYGPFLDSIEHFDEIKSIENQAHFIGALQWPFLALGNTHFKFLIDFLLKCIEHQSGRIREAILNKVDWITIGVDIEPKDYRAEKPTHEQLDLMSKNYELYFEFVESAEKLIKKYDEPRFDKYEYIDEMPPSIYKSIQYLLNYKLIRNFEYDIKYRGYLRMKNNLRSNLESGIDVIKQAEKIIALQKMNSERERIEKELDEKLEETESDFSLFDIREIIYEEDGPDDLTKIISVFDTGQDATELDNILELVNDAWNYFPHRILEGLSPAEKMLEYEQSQH